MALRTPTAVLMTASLLLAACSSAAPAAPTPAPAQPTTAAKPTTAAVPTSAPAATTQPAAAAQPSAQTQAAAKPSGPADKVIMITDFGFSGGYAPFFAGVKEGFFKDQNIDLTIQPGASSGDTATKIGAAVGQFGLVDTFAIATAVSKGANIKAVASWFQKHPGGICGIEENHPLNTYKDLEHIKVGDTGTGYYQFLPQLMRDHGADPDTIDLIRMDSAAASAALLNGQIDGTSCGANTNATRIAAAAKLGHHLSFFSYANNGFAGLGHSLVVNGDVLNKNPDLVQRFVNAWAKSLVWGAQNEDKAIADYIEANPEQDGKVEIDNLKGAIPNYLDKAAAGQNGLFVFPQSKLQATVDYANKAYDLNVKVDDAFTNQFALKIPADLRQAQLPGT